jgi:hypothetical protein
MAEAGPAPVLEYDKKHEHEHGDTDDIQHIVVWGVEFGGMFEEGTAAAADCPCPWGLTRRAWGVTPNGL